MNFIMCGMHLKICGILLSMNIYSQFDQKDSVTLTKSILWSGWLEAPGKGSKWILINYQTMSYQFVLNSWSNGFIQDRHRFKTNSLTD